MKDERTSREQNHEGAQPQYQRDQADRPQSRIEVEMSEDRMTEETKKHEDEPKKEPKPAPQNEPDDAFCFIPGVFIPGSQL